MWWLKPPGIRRYSTARPENIATRPNTSSTDPAQFVIEPPSYL
jgi:hypothetical protein